jgi:PKD repeat protein
MRTIAWVASLLILSVALAGCSGGDDDTSTKTTTSQTTSKTTTGTTTTGTGTGTGTTTTGPGGSMSASLSVDKPSGAAPLAVEFTVDADGQDASDSWELVFGDGTDPATGSAADLPVKVKHTYEDKGTFQAQLTVDFGGGQKRGDSKEISVVEVPGPGGPSDQLKEWEVHLSIPVPYTSNPGMTTADFVKTSVQDGANGTYVASYDIVIEEGALEMDAVAVAPIDDPGGLTPDYDMYVYDPDWVFVDSSGAGATAEQVTVSSPKPGAWKVVLLFWAGAEANSPATLTVGIDYP